MNAYLSQLFAAVASRTLASSYEEVLANLETFSHSAPLSDWEVLQVFEASLEYLSGHPETSETPEAEVAYLDDNYHTFHLTRGEEILSVAVGRSTRPPTSSVEVDPPQALARALEADLEGVWRDLAADECLLYFPEFVVRAGYGWVEISVDLPTTHLLRWSAGEARMEFVTIDEEGVETVEASLSSQGTDRTPEVDVVA